MTLGRLGHNESYFSLTFHARGFLKELRGNNNNCVLSVPKRRNDTLTDYPNACETLRCPDETRTIHGCEEAHFPHAWAHRSREDRRRREEKDAARGERGKGGEGPLHLPDSKRKNREVGIAYENPGFSIL